MIRANVCVVIVTYGNRFKYLSQVVESVLSQEVYKIIIVDNNSSFESKQGIKQLEKHLGNKIEVVYLPENLGSAGGYKRGLEKAYNDPGCEFIWLLDDDNQPDERALCELLKFWHTIEEFQEKEKEVVLSSFRISRLVYKRAVLQKKPYLVLGRENSFLGFHFIDIPYKIFARIKPLSLQKEYFLQSITSGIVPVAPYGGLFFHKCLLESIGFPEEKYFLYSDDHEWTYRITKAGGKIFIVFGSLIKDLDVSWHVKEQNSMSFLSILHEKSQMRIYYAIRNRILFERENLVTMPLVYFFNLALYRLILGFFQFLDKHKSLSAKNLEIFDKAIIDGLKGFMGKNENFNF